MTGCQEDEFTCNDGQCISMEGRCDKLVQCEDSSDEQDCKILVLPENYNKRLPPLPRPDQTEGKSFDLQINVTLTILSIQNLDKTRGSFQMNFDATYEWFDRRVLFHNLKQKSNLNTLFPLETEGLWLPRAKYSRTTTQRRQSEKELATKKVTVSRQGGYVRSGRDVADEIEIFDGAENKLSMKEEIKEEFLCRFSTFWYPFDKQVG